MYFNHAIAGNNGHFYLMDGEECGRMWGYYGCKGDLYSKRDAQHMEYSQDKGTPQ